MLSGGMKMSVEHGMLRAGIHFFVMTSVILSGGVKMRAEHGMLREVYIFCHDFCHTFRSSMECLGRYTFFVMTSVIATKRPANKSWSAVSRLRRIAITF